MNTMITRISIIRYVYRLQIVCVQCSEVVLKWFFWFLFVCYWFFVGVVASVLVCWSFFLLMAERAISVTFVGFWVEFFDSFLIVAVGCWICMDWWTAAILFSVVDWIFLLLFVFQGMLLGVIDSDLALTNCISMTSQYTCPSTTYNSPLQCIVENFLAAVNVFLRRPSGGCVNTTSIGPHMSADRYGVTSNIIW